MDAGIMRTCQVKWIQITLKHRRLTDLKPKEGKEAPRPPFPKKLQQRFK